MSFFHHKHTFNSPDSDECIDVPTDQSWRPDAHERRKRFEEQMQRLTARSRELEQKQSEMHMDDNDCKMPDVASEDEEMKEPIHGSMWNLGDVEKKSGCALLARIIGEFARMEWDPLQPAGPFPDCVALGLSFVVNLISEEVMDFILDILRWWQEEDVSLPNYKLPNNTKQLKREKKKLLPDLEQFVGLTAP